MASTLTLEEQRGYWQKVKDNATAMLRELDLQAAVEARGKTVDLTDQIEAIKAETPKDLDAYTSELAIMGVDK